jgi:hypothetical protein
MAWIWSDAVVAAAHGRREFPRALMEEWGRSTAAWQVPDGVTALEVAQALRDGLQPKTLTPQEAVA